MNKVDVSVQHVETSVSDLKLGMYVSELDIPWLESPFLFQGFVIETREELEQLRQVCRTVKVDMLRGGARPATDWDHVEAVDTYTMTVERELRSAAGARRGAYQLVQGVFRQIDRGQGIDGNAVQASVSDTVDSVLRNPDALVLLSQIKKKDNYTAEHCINVSVLTAAFARFLGQTREKIEEAAYCALLYDVGKIRVPRAVLNKRGRFNPEELALMQSHTERGRDVLKASRNVAPAALDVALAHHEHVDGSGYPHSLSNDIIPFNARLIAVTDAYDAITSARCYKPATSPFDALQMMYNDRNRHFDGSLVERFIEFVGVYPPGSIVEMSNGEAGIVISVPPKHKLEPRIMLVRDRFGEPRQELVIDMQSRPKDNLGDPYRIERCHANGSFEIDIKDYLKRGLKLPGVAGERRGAEIAGSLTTSCKAP